MRRFKLRDVILSVEYRLWNILLHSGRTRSASNFPLKPLSGPRIPPNTYGIEGGFPWVFIAKDGINPKQKVNLYDSGSPITDNSYSINWLHSYVSLDSQASGQITADFDYFEVNVNQGYNQNELKRSDLPLISFWPSANVSTPLGVGTRSVFSEIGFEVELLATSRNQLQDLMDELVLGLGFIPILEYTREQPLGGNGDINENFDPHELFITVANIYRDSYPDGDIIKPRSDSPSYHEHRAMITFEIKESR